MALGEPQRRMKIAKTKCCVFNATLGYFRRSDTPIRSNRRVMKACLLKESLERLWTYRYEGAMLRYLQSWIDQLRWQRLVPFENLAFMLPDHLDGILTIAAPRYASEWWKPSMATSKPFFEGDVATRISAIYCSSPNGWPSPRPNSSFFRKRPRVRVYTNSCAEPKKLTD